MGKKRLVCVLFILLCSGLCTVGASDGVISIGTGVGLTFAKRDSLNFFDDPDFGANLTVLALGRYSNTVEISMNFLGSIFFSPSDTQAEVKFSYSNPFFSSERWVDQNLRALVFFGLAMGIGLDDLQVEASVGPMLHFRLFYGPYEWNSDDSIWGHEIEAHYATSFGFGVNLATSMKVSKKSEKSVAAGCLFGVLSGKHTLNAGQGGDFVWNEGEYYYLIHPYLSIML